MSKISELSDGGVIQGGDTLIAVRSGGNVKVTYGGSTTANIDGGTIDGTTIGGTTPAAGNFTTVTADGLTVDGGATTTLKAGGFTANSETTLELAENRDGSNNLYFGFKLKTDGAGDNNFHLLRHNNSTSGNKAFSVGRDTGDISFYENTGTTAKFRWDASTERLGIGTTNPQHNLDVLSETNASASARIEGGSNLDSSLSLTESGNSGFKFTYDGGDNKLYIGSGTSGSFTTRMALNRDNGNVGIGTHSPTGKLDVVLASNNRLLFTTTGSDTFVSSVNEANNAYSNLFINGAVVKLGTGGAEAMRIDSSGNVLVSNTEANPAQNNTTDAISLHNAGLLRASTTNAAAPLDLNVKSRDGDIATFRKDGTQVGSIGAVAGDIVIGTGACGIRFHDGTPALQPRNTDGTANNDAIDIGLSGNRFKDLYLSRRVNFKGASGDHFAGYDGSVDCLQLAAKTFIRFQSGTNYDEAARIDASGNLLVGTTDLDLGFTDGDAGFMVSPTGYVQSARDSANANVYINKLNNDGTLVQFAKDGTTVGSIGTMNFGDMYLGTDDTGIYFNNGTDQIVPVNTTNQSPRDNAISLGASNVRFKDLYLSGGVVFGATSGNVTSKTLDDYEEGTFTPSWQASTTTVTVNHASYTKVGRMVTVNFYIANIAPATSSDIQYIQGLPFVVASGHYPVGSIGYSVLADTANLGVLAGAGTQNIYFHEIDGTSVAALTRNDWNSLLGSGLALIISLTYMTT